MALVIRGTHSSSNISTDGHGRYTVAGTWAYRLGGRHPPRTKREAQKYADAHLQGVAKRGFKLGMKIKRGQTVELFSFRGTRGDVVLAADDAVSRDLADAFGADAHERWIGLVPTAGSQRKPTFPEVGVVAYSYKLVVSGVEHEPQALIVVATHQDTNFRQHYLMHVQFLSTRPARITTDVEALFTARSRSR
jgi:hypothetical protein